MGEQWEGRSYWLSRCGKVGEVGHVKLASEFKKSACKVFGCILKRESTLIHLFVNSTLQISTQGAEKKCCCNNDKVLWTVTSLIWQYGLLFYSKVTSQCYTITGHLFSCTYVFFYIICTFNLNYLFGPKNIFLHIRMENL